MIQPFSSWEWCLRPGQMTSTFASTIQRCWKHPPPPPSQIMKHVELKLNQSWMSLIWKHLNFASTTTQHFVCYCKCWNEGEAFCPPLWTLLCTCLCTNQSLNHTSMSISIVTTAAAALDWISGSSWSFVEANVDDVLKPFAHSSSQRRSTKSNGCQSKCWSHLPTPLCILLGVIPDDFTCQWGWGGVEWDSGVKGFMSASHAFLPVAYFHQPTNYY